MVTSGQSNLTRCCISSAYESFKWLQPDNISCKQFQH